MDDPVLFTRTNASEAIQRLLISGLNPISFARHVHERGSKRNFNTRDAQHVLKTGAVIEDPVWNERFENWTCKVRGADLDGDELTVVVALDPACTHIRVITGF